MSASRKRGLLVVLGLVVLAVVGWVVFRGRGTGAGGGAAAPQGKQGASEGDQVAADRARLESPDPLTSPRGSIAGRITGPDGKGLRGAAVCGFAESDEVASSETVEPVCATSGADGGYRLDGLFAARWRVSAAAAGHLPATWRDAEKRTSVTLAPGAARTGIDIALRAGGVELRGHVKDISGGVVAGALVSASSGNWWSGRGGTVITRSDANGEFVLWVAEGNFNVTANAEGYAPGSKWGRAPSSVLEILLTPESVLVGRVVEASSGVPVAGAMVDAGGGEDFSFGWSGGGSSALTDAEGKFRIARLEPGRYKPSAETRGRYGKAAESVLLGLGETSAEVLIEVHAAYIVSGRVVVAGDPLQPCSRGWLSVEDEVRGRGDADRTDETGAVTFRALMPGTYTVRVFCQGKLSADSYPKVVVADADVTGLVWEVGDGRAIRGVIVDSTGAPVEEASVRGQKSGGDPRAQRSQAWAQAEPDGTFEMEGLLAGSYKLHVNADGHPAPKDPVVVELAADRDTDNVKITLDASGAVEGQVVDESGAPVVDVEVRAEGARQGSWWNSQASTRDDGSFRLKGIAAGEYRIVAARDWTPLRAPGATDDDPPGVRTTVAVGKTSRVRIVVERQSGEIRGRVVDEQGKGVGDAFLDAQRESDAAGADPRSARQGLRWAWNRKPVLTDVDGNFVLDGLAKGKYTLRAHRKGGGEAIAEHVVTGASVTLAILSTATITGTVVGAKGEIPETFEIQVEDRAGGFQRSEHFFRTGGQFAMKDLPAGSYEISVDAPEGTATDKLTLTRGQVSAGMKLVLTGRAGVKGQVVELITGAPIPALRVMVQPIHGVENWNTGWNDSERKNITDADGRFEIQRVPAGRVWVYTVPLDWQSREYGTGLAVVVIQPSGITELPPIRVPKRRVKDGEEAGDLGFDLKEDPADTEPEDMTVRVVRIVPDGPASRTALQVGDDIVSIDGHDVRGVNSYLYPTLAEVLEGTTVTLGLARGVTVSIKAGKPR